MRDCLWADDFPKLFKQPSSKVLPTDRILFEARVRSAWKTSTAIACQFWGIRSGPGPIRCACPAKLCRFTKATPSGTLQVQLRTPDLGEQPRICVREPPGCARAHKFSISWRCIRHCFALKGKEDTKSNLNTELASKWLELAGHDDFRTPDVGDQQPCVRVRELAVARCAHFR